MRQILRKIKTRIHAEAGKRDVTAQQGASGRSGVTQTRVRGRTHARRIAQPDVPAIGGNVKIKTVAVRQKAAESQLTAAGLGTELFNLHAVLANTREPLMWLRPFGRSTNEMPASARSMRPFNCGCASIAANVDGEGSRPVGDDVRVIALQKLKIHAAIGSKFQNVVAGYADAAEHKDISIFAHQVELIEAREFAVHGEAHWTVILKPYVFKFGGKLVGNAGNDQFARMAERAVDVNGAGDG